MEYFYFLVHQHPQTLMKVGCGCHVRNNWFPFHFIQNRSNFFSRLSAAMNSSDLEMCDTKDKIIENTISLAYYISRPAWCYHGMETWGWKHLSIAWFSSCERNHGPDVWICRSLTISQISAAVFMLCLLVLFNVTHALEPRSVPHLEWM